MVFRKTQVLEKPIPPTKNGKTRIEVRCDCGFPNNLYIRGEGGGLSWTKGLPLKNIDRDRWLFEIESSFSYCEFKLLLNDHQYEKGPNHKIAHGEEITLRPQF